MSINTAPDNSSFISSLDELIKTTINNEVLYGINGATTDGESKLNNPAITTPFSVVSQVQNDEKQTIIPQISLYLTRLQEGHTPQYDLHYKQYISLITLSGGVHPNTFPEWSFAFTPYFAINDFERIEVIPDDCFVNLGNGNFALSLSALDSHNSDNIGNGAQHTNPVQEIKWIINTHIYNTFIATNLNQNLILITDNTLAKPPKLVKHRTFVNKTLNTINFVYRVIQSLNVVDYPIIRGKMANARYVGFGGVYTEIKGVSSILEIDGTKFPNGIQFF